MIKTNNLQQMTLCREWMRASEDSSLGPEKRAESVALIEAELSKGDVALHDLLSLRNPKTGWRKTECSGRVRWNQRQNGYLYILFVRANSVRIKGEFKRAGTWVLLEINDAKGVKEYYDFLSFAEAEHEMLRRISTHDDGEPLPQEWLDKLPKILEYIDKRNGKVKPRDITRKLCLEPTPGNIAKACRLINAGNLLWMPTAHDGKGGWMEGAFVNPKDAYRICVSGERAKALLDFVKATKTG